MTAPGFTAADLAHLPAHLRDALSVLSPIELVIVHRTLDGVAAHRIAEEVGWREHQVKAWRQQRGLTERSRSEVTAKAMALGCRPGPLGKAPTYDDLAPLYGEQRYRSADRSDVDRWHGQRSMALAPARGKRAS